MADENKERKTKRQKYTRLSEAQKQELKDKGISIELYYRRRKRGWNYDQIINTPVRQKTLLTQKEKEILKSNNIDENAFHVRIARGWGRNRALNEPTDKKQDKE